MAAIKRPVRLLVWVYLRDREMCHLCGLHVMRSEASLDHLLPRYSGGVMAEANLALAHKPCNHARGALPMPLARAAIDALVFDHRMLDWERREMVVKALKAAAKVWHRENVVDVVPPKPVPFREQSKPWSPPPREKLRQRFEWDQEKREWVDAPDFGEPTTPPSRTYAVIGLDP